MTPRYAIIGHSAFVPDAPHTLSADMTLGLGDLSVLSTVSSSVPQSPSASRSASQTESRSDPGPVSQRLIRTLGASLETRPDGMERWPRLDRYGKALAVACNRAVRRDQLQKGPHTGMSVSSLWSCHETNCQFDQGLIDKGPRLASPLLFPYTLPGSTASEVAMLLGLVGPYVVFPGGPASALVSLVSALDILNSGGAERMLVASADVLGPHTLATVAACDAWPGPDAPVLAEAAAAAWLALPDDCATGPRLGIEAALGACEPEVDSIRRLVKEALERAEVTTTQIEHTVIATVDSALRAAEVEVASELWPATPALQLAWRTGDVGAPLGLLAFLAAQQEGGTALVLASDRSGRVALVVSG